ncbi:hypothetical protein K440DRAFT_628062 [Wilcoxina mikolae CBS 423.85]|nr:hypothetical protein K440DRAFT_628062 [Wilcoxina mikolae CBS 423.85]
MWAEPESMNVPRIPDVPATLMTCLTTPVASSRQRNDRKPKRYIECAETFKSLLRKGADRGSFVAREGFCLSALFVTWLGGLTLFQLASLQQLNVQLNVQLTPR